MGIPEATFSDMPSVDSDVGAGDSSPPNTTVDAISQPGSGETPYADPPEEPEIEVSIDDLPGGVADGRSQSAEWFTDDLRQQAIDYGMTREQAEAFGTSDALRNALAYHDQRMLEAGNAWREYDAAQQAMAEQQWRWQQQQLQQQQMPTPPQHGQHQTPQATGLRYDLQLKPEEYGEEFVNALSGMNDHYTSLLSRMGDAQQRMSQMMARMGAEYDQQTRRQQAAIYWRDLQDGVRDLGDGYEELFGKDPGALETNSPQYANWHRLNQTMQTIVRGYQSQGLRPPAVRAVVRNAVAFAFPQHIEARATNLVKSQVKSRQNSFVSKPSNAPGRPLSGEESAVRKIDAFRRAAGIDDMSSF